jgi:CspA family cold shock protein
MSHGTVKFFNAAKGFGFITPDEGGKDIFVPAASVLSSGIKTLKPGQRVSFEIKPDTRGPMAVSLVLLAEPPRPEPPRERSPQNSRNEERHRLLFYFDPADDNAQSALEDLRAAGHEPMLIDYVATPLNREELKTLSAQLGNKNQSLVKKYASLFYDLRLNDRFLSQNDFWDAIVEHPSLINGPIVATATDANLFSTRSGVEGFLATNFPNVVPVESGGKKVAELTKKEESLVIEGAESGVADEPPEAPKETLARKPKTVDSPKEKVRAALKTKAAAKKAVAKPAKKSSVKAPKS